MTRLRVDSWAAGGRGVGRVDGRVHLVAGAVPGDEVTARILKDHGRFVEAEVERLERPSGTRRPPPCPIQGACGGCPLMAVDEAAQRSAKRQFLIDAMRRIGGLPADVPVEDVIAVPPDLAYRNKVELSFGRGPASAGVLGYHGVRPSDWVDVSDCAIARPELRPLLEAARAFFLDGPGVGDPAILNADEPLRLVLRTSGSGEERLVAFRGLPGPFPSLREFALRASQADPHLVGVVRLLAPRGRRGGAVVETVAGRAWIAEVILGTSFRVPAATFLQVHARAAERMGEHVVDLSGSPGRVVELYAGVGALGLALARRGATATIVDADGTAIACGAEAARTQGLEGAEFVRADVLSFLERGGRGLAPDLVIADPPRSGLGRGVAKRLAALGAARLAIVSCDPATLARDLAALAGWGYTVERVTPFDLFPQTAHVEAVAWLRR